eukprot:3931906-Rhodomonas_salina.2
MSGTDLPCATSLVRVPYAPTDIIGVPYDEVPAYLSPYALPTRFSGTDLARSSASICTGTPRWYCSPLCTRFAMSGTDISYPSTRITGGFRSFSTR